MAGRNEPGRGAYTCRNVACFERAAGRGTFARVLRRQVRVGLSCGAFTLMLQAAPAKPSLRGERILEHDG